MIDKTSGALSFAAGPDFESPTDANEDHVYQVVVEARDGAWATPRRSPSPYRSRRRPVVPADHASGAGRRASRRGVLSASGGNGDPMNYTIAGGADAALFALDAQTGALSFVAARDFEAPGDADGDNVYQVEVNATTAP